jgi:hypothetical protein
MKGVSFNPDLSRLLCQTEIRTRVVCLILKEINKFYTNDYSAIAPFYNFIRKIYKNKYRNF